MACLTVLGAARLVLWDFTTVPGPGLGLGQGPCRFGGFWREDCLGIMRLWLWRARWDVSAC